jgi:hypothetical protein
MGRSSRATNQALWVKGHFAHGRLRLAQLASSHAPNAQSEI